MCVFSAEFQVQIPVFILNTLSVLLDKLSVALGLRDYFLFIDKAPYPQFDPILLENELHPQLQNPEPPFPSAGK